MHSDLRTVTADGVDYFLDMDFAVEAAGTDRMDWSWQVLVGWQYTAYNNKAIQMKMVDGADAANKADLQVYDGSTSAYVTVLSDMFVADSDVQVSPDVHYFQLTTHLAPVAADTTYDITVTTSGSVVHSVTGLKHFWGPAPTTADNIEWIRYANGMLGSYNGADWLMDNVTLVPEPSTFVMLILGALICLVVLRRRRR